MCTKNQPVHRPSISRDRLAVEIKAIVHHTSNIVPERLAEWVWCTKFQSSLLNIYFRFNGFQSSLLPIYFRDGPNSCSHCTKLSLWHKNYPICDAPLSRSARRSFAQSAVIAPPQLTALVCQQKPYLI